MFKAIGTILLLVALRLMMPSVWSGLETTLVQVLEVAQGTLAESQTLMQTAGTGYGLPLNLPSVTLGY